jgi:2-polyprenyl-3-methyl-5-hydroxy-6-metoxy-1,4-benzoquinol methylase
MSFNKPIERILLPKEQFLQIEHQIRLQEHLRRYAAIRRFIYGRVLDFACGCGYGTHLLATNPEISTIVGVDKDEESIKWAGQEYETTKCKFLCQDVTTLNQKFDTLVSLETIEHFEDNSIYHSVIENCQIDQIIISYPNKKSTHFNPFHVRDLNIQQVCNVFQDFILYHTFVLGDVSFLLFIRKPKLMPAHIFLNIQDLK